jgi:hypothetical protein
MMLKGISKSGECHLLEEKNSFGRVPNELLNAR